MLEWQLSKRQEESVGKDVVKRECLYTVGGNVNRCSHYGKQYWDSSKTRTWSSNSIPWYLTKGNKNTNSKRYLHQSAMPLPPLFTAALFTIANTWKQLKCPSIDEWIKKMCVCVYSSAIKKEILPFATTWGHYAEWNKSEKDKYHTISLIRGL